MNSDVPMSYDSSIGAIFIGSLLDIFFLGIVLSQAFTYFRIDDRKVFKYPVIFLMIIATLHSIFVADLMYDWGVTNYGNPDHLTRATFAYAIDLPFTGITSFVCQGFFAYRVHLVAKRRDIPIVIIFLASLSLIFSIACFIKEYEYGLVFSAFPQFEYGVVIWIASAVLADLLITSTLCFHLRKERRSDYSSTNKIIDSVIKLTVSTNATTTIAAILTVICFAVVPDLYGSIVQLILAKLYFNSFLSALNSRASLSQRLANASNPVSASHKSPRANKSQIYSTAPVGMTTMEIKPIRINISEVVQIDEPMESDKSLYYGGRAPSHEV